MSFDTQQDLARALGESGLDAQTVATLAAQARPAVWLETRLAPEDQIAVGATRIGGRPDMPRDAAWPGRLHFLAQINWAEVWAAGPVDEDMPRTGLLSIFYDLEGTPWGYDPAHGRGSAFLWHDLPAPELVRRDPPPTLPELDEEMRIQPMACALHACWTPLPPELSAWQALGLPKAVGDRLGEWWLDDAELGASTEGGDACCHRIGGWPTPIQGDMQAEAALVHGGASCGDASAYNDPALAGVRATATDWLPLAQIGTDEKGGLYWGDEGQLYLWIRREDLRARRFDQARLFLQCY